MKEFELTQQLNDRIYKHFTGMDDKYVKLIRNYHDVYLDKIYTKEYKNKERLATQDNIKLFKKKAELAKTEIDKIKDEHSEKPQAKNYSIDEKIYNLNLWSKIFPTSTIEELKTLYADNSVDEDFMRLLIAELRTRGLNGDTKAKTMLLEIENGVLDNRFIELDKLITAFNTWASMDNYPAYITDSLVNVKYRNVSHDLSLFPIDKGPAIRPLFKLYV